MIRRSFRIGTLLGIVAGAGAALVRWWRRTEPQPLPDATDAWPPPVEPDGPGPLAVVEPTVDQGWDEELAEPEPEGEEQEDEAPPVAPPAPRSTPPARSSGAGRRARRRGSAKRPLRVSWVEPDDGACPSSHPVKAKLSSGIFHLPGMAAYDRTRADRCYKDEASASEDGLRSAKR